MAIEGRTSVLVQRNFASSWISVCKGDYERNMKKQVFVVLVFGVAWLGLQAPLVRADAVSGTIFFTTFSGGENVWTDTFNYNGTTFTLGSATNIASTSGADGLLFLPDGNLAVAGQGNNLTEVTTGGTIVKTVAPGGPSFHLALTSSSPTALLYNMWNGGGNTPISAVTLSGGGLLNNGVAYTVTCPTGCSTDVRGVIFDPKTSTWYYGTAGDGGSGNFGIVTFNDVAHTATLGAPILTGVFAHGLTFDPFTNDIIFSSAGTISQFDPTSNTIVSNLAGTGNFDQSAVDGKGHLFVASNSGFLEFVDYDATGKIGAAGNFTAEPFLEGSLDDIAPLSGSGAPPPVPEPSTWVMLTTGLLGLGRVVRSKMRF